MGSDDAGIQGTFAVISNSANQEMWYLNSTNEDTIKHAIK